jgi:RNA polymerase sigma factor (sigma-70 family)
LLRCPPAVRSARVSEALDQLTELEGEALVLAARAGLSVEDIGSRLGVSSEEVHQLLRRGLERVRHALERTLRRESL